MTSTCCSLDANVDRTRGQADGREPVGDIYDHAGHLGSLYVNDFNKP